MTSNNVLTLTLKDVFIWADLHNLEFEGDSMPDTVPIFDPLQCCDKQRLIERLVRVKDPVKDLPDWIRKRASVKWVFGIQNPGDCTVAELQQLLVMSSSATKRHDERFGRKQRANHMIVVEKVSTGEWMTIRADHPHEIQHLFDLEAVGIFLETVFDAPVPAEGIYAASL